VHNGGETTSDSFTYKANDGAADSNVATVTITITAVNDAPVANNDGPHTVAEGGTLAGPSVLANDTDAENDSLTAILVTGPAHASSFSLNPDGTFTYVHDGSETTTDSFTYRANDGSANSNVATVTITITPVNDAPVANGDTYSTGFHGTLNITAPGVLGNDTDAEGNSLTAVLVTSTTQGTLSFNADGSFTYNHTGSSLGTDSFTYQAQDAFGGISNVATVTINIVNAPPVAANDAYASVGNTELRVGTGSALYPAVVVSGSVLGNDSDPDGGPSPLTVTGFSATSTAGGTVNVNANGSFTYLPPTGFLGTDTFTYTISDGVATATGTVSVTMTERVWYVNALAAGAQTGRSPDPFATLGQAQSASAVNDYIHVAQGAYSTGITLKNGQRLVGSGVALVVGPYTLAGATVRPNVAGTILLANGDLVTGLNVSSGANGISGTSVAGGSIVQVDINGGTNGIQLSNATGTFTVTDVNVASGTNGFALLGGTKTLNATNIVVTTTGGVGITGTGGSLNVSGASSVSSTGFAAVDLGSMALGVSLVSVNASGGSTGISLTNTTGSFTVTGTGSTAGSGGTIQNTSARGAQFNGATNVTLKNMNFTNAATANGTTATICGDTAAGTNTGCNAAIHLVNVNTASLLNVAVAGSAQIGINGNGVSNLTMTGVSVTNAGNEASEHGVQFHNLSGTSSVSGSTFSGNFSRQFAVVNASVSGTLNVSGSTFNGTGVTSSTGSDGLLVLARGTGAATANVQSGTFTNNFSFGFHGESLDTATLDATVNGGTFTTNGGGIVIATSNASNSSFAITNNVLNFTGTNVIGISKFGSGASSGTIVGNSIGTTGVPLSGCSVVGCFGIDLSGNGTGSLAATVTNNIIKNFDGRGISGSAQSGSNSMSLSIKSNTVSEPSAAAFNGIFVQSGALTTDSTSVCADIASNTISGTYSSTLIRVRNRFPATTFRLPGYAGAGNSTAAVATFLSSQNGGASASATINGNIFGGGAACPTP
jgi:VCBS repeat-containing protein